MPDTLTKDVLLALDAGADIRATIIHENCKTTSADDDTLIGPLNIHDLFCEGLM